MRRTAPPLAIAALALLVQACDPQFDPCFSPVQHVKDLRVLAVRADPPEVVYDPAAAALPSVKVTALVADPGQVDEVRLTALLCAPTDDRRCPGGSRAINAAVGRPGELAIVVRPTFDELEAAKAADPLHGYGGVRLQLDLTANASFDRSVTAAKVLVFSPQAPGYVPNHGFEIAALGVTERGAPAGYVTPTTSLGLTVGEFVGLTPLLLPGPGAAQAQEEFDVVDLAGRPAHLREHISYDLYTTLHARFLVDHIDEPATGTPPDLRGLVRFEPTGEAFGKLYVVARDGRGAVAWLQADWSAVDARTDEKKTSLETACAE